MADGVGVLALGFFLLADVFSIVEVLGEGLCDSVEFVFNHHVDGIVVEAFD